MNLSLDGYTQITKGKIKKGDLVECNYCPLEEARGLIGGDINSYPDWKCYRKMPKSKPKLKPKTPPNLPNGLPTPPKDYVFLGKVKDIVTPKSWVAVYNGNRELLDLAIPSCSGGWFKDNGWTNSNSETYIAAEVGSPLYNMQNFTTTKSPDPALEIAQLKAKLQSAEGALSARTAEVNGVKNELLEVKRNLGNTERARDTYKNMYRDATAERINMRAELTEIKETAKKLNCLVNS